MTKPRLLFFCLLVSCAFARADDFSQANADYEAGRYQQAADGYEKILQKDGPRVGVLQNLGGAYHKLGADGRAILAFERAKVLQPDSAAVAADLNLVRTYPTDAPDRWQALAGHWSARRWSWLLLGGIALFPLAAVLRLFGRGALPVGVALTGLALILLSVVALRALPDQSRRGVIVASPATLRLSPFASAEEKGSLPSGREVRLDEFKDGFYHLQTPDGSAIGWVSDKEVEPVIPTDRVPSSGGV